MAENKPVRHLFPQGCVRIKSSYRKLVGRSLFVYCAMERERESSRANRFGPKIASDALNRRSSLEGRSGNFLFRFLNWRSTVQSTPPAAQE